METQKQGNSTVAGVMLRFFVHENRKCHGLLAYEWLLETAKKLGVHGGTAYYLLYNGILGDLTLAGGNMLTLKLLASLPAHDGPMVIYGEGTNLSDERLRSLGITFKKTPNDIRAR